MVVTWKVGVYELVRVGEEVKFVVGVDIFHRCIDFILLHRLSVVIDQAPIRAFEFHFTGAPAGVDESPDVIDQDSTPRAFQIWADWWQV